MNNKLTKKRGIEGLLANLYNDYYFFLRSLYKHLDGTATQELTVLIKICSQRFVNTIVRRKYLFKNKVWIKDLPQLISSHQYFQNLLCIHVSLSRILTVGLNQDN